MSDTARIDQPLLEGRGLVKHFGAAGRLGRGRREVAQAVAGVSVAVREGETLGLVGESGCGKSTTARLLARLLDPTAGSVHYRGRDITALGRSQLVPLRREIQVVFQDPYSSLDPRQTVGSIIAEPFAIHDLEPDRRRRRSAVQALMEQVGLNPEHYNRLPHEFSGGQRQRIGIARAIALSPRVLIADEPVSALDVSIQAQILNLLRTLQRDLDLTIVFIAHDLSVVRHMCDRVAVMYLGTVVEEAEGEELFAAPRHPYTRALLGAIPLPEPGARERQRTRQMLGGDAPSPTDPPSGCRFHPRCRIAIGGRCDVAPPPLQPRLGGGHVACHVAHDEGRAA
jgi:peptide/nickel transport system ATP-binding protein/oligopeptide transport system ATP-binding protein